MNAKLIGGILLIVGTSIGGGMLALPIATAQGGFLGALILLISIWILMTIGAFLILEVNLWFPRDSNLISMAKHTLGPWGQMIAWVTYLLLLYSLLAAYSAGGSDIFGYLLGLIHIKMPSWLNILIFIGILGYVVYLGIELLDIVNRGLMLIKFTTLILLLIFITPHIVVERLDQFHHKYLVSAITVVITSFGYSPIIPSLRSYFHDDVKKLRQVIFIGSLIPLICYIIWIAAVLGEVPLQGKYGLLEILRSGQTTSALTQSLIAFLKNPWLSTVAGTFTSICVFTSFLGVALCLSDFLADGLSMAKKGFNQVWIYAATFLPPFIMVLVDPRIFIVSLSFAGIFCAILLILMPALMAWSGRYQQKLSDEYQVWGGKSILVLLIIASVLIILYEILVKVLT